MTAGRAGPSITVLMHGPAAARALRQSIQSVLAQTVESLELCCWGAGGADDRADLAAAVGDDRVVPLRGGAADGAAAAMRRALRDARGRDVAWLDAGDLMQATRLAAQAAVLDSMPGVALVASETSLLVGGRVLAGPRRGDEEPVVAAWMLHLGAMLSTSSVLARREVVAGLGDDAPLPSGAAAGFDFTHRMLQRGLVMVLPERLTILREPPRLAPAEAEPVLARTYRLLGDPHAEADAALIARHALGDGAAPAVPLHDAIERLERLFMARHRPDERVRMDCVARTAEFLARPPGARPPGARTAPAPARLPPPLKQEVLQVGGERFVPEPPDPDQPPRLYVVVDTEAEFDWDSPMLRDAIAVGSIAEQHHAQAIFDRHGVRPIYTVDYAVASQQEGVAPLRAILERHGCAIGAHLHPWVNPPLEEELTERNTFAGNLPAELEERKLRVLIDTIEEGFGVRPLFFKAGRYGVGPNTMRIIAQLGIEVDFSVLPLADIRPRGGPDYRMAGPLPYRTAGGRVLSLPMTRAQVGLLPPMPTRLHGAAHSARGIQLRIPGILSRSGLLSTVTLTPEGMTVAEQGALLRAMLDRGVRQFVLHYHSSSLGATTPYVHTAADRDAFLANIAAVCHDFFHRLGGLAGNPADLVRPESRCLIWPSTLKTLRGRPPAIAPATVPDTGPG
jgi:hypothetical protein